MFRAFVTWRFARSFYISNIAFFKVNERYKMEGDKALYSTIRDKAL
jgi:hypothetical protein